MAVAVAGEGGLLCLVSIIKTRQNRVHEQGGREKGQGRKGKTSRNLAKCFGRNLCAAHANICRGRRAAEGEWGEKGQAVGPPIDRWMVASI